MKGRSGEGKLRKFLNQKRKFLPLLTILIFVGGIISGVTSYNFDQAQTLKARDLARQDLQLDLSNISRNFSFVFPKNGTTNCIQNAYFLHYVSQICYLNGKIGARGEENRFEVIYLKPNSRFYQWINIKNEIYFQYIYEMGDLVALVTGNGFVKIYGSNADD